MDQRLIPTIFFTLFFVVDPLGLIPYFLSTLASYETRTRIRIILKANLYSALISILFVLASDIILKYLNINPSSFIIAGGILLFLISIDMIYGRSMKIRAKGPASPPEESEDPSIFPLAIPMLSGPGNVAALLMFTSQTQGSYTARVMIIFISLSIFLLSTIILVLSMYLMKIFGEGGLAIIHRLMGLILSALSVQFIVNGLKGLGILS